MTTSDKSYSAGRLPISSTVIPPAVQFNFKVIKVLGALSLFFLVYISLISAAVLVSFICIRFSLHSLASFTDFCSVVMAMAVAGVCIMIFVFLLKFIFPLKKYDDVAGIAVTATEQPELYTFIRKVTTDTGTRFPNKIILSPEVNASVHYHNGFWGMFFPATRNLQIGLGLINVLNVSEFRAVMAHEFGHFSQKSMRLVSYVNSVSKIIGRSLHYNQQYAMKLQRWGNRYWVFFPLIRITVALLSAILKMLQKIYSLINLSFMGLSRQMEFHADAIAANVGGSRQMISALRKIETGNACYAIVLEKANEWLAEKKAVNNIYTLHKLVIRHYANKHNLRLINGMPVCDDKFYQPVRQSRINVSDEWASHPLREKREAILEKLAIEAPADSRSAWLLFNNTAVLQASLTEIIYDKVPAELKTMRVGDEMFSKKYFAEAGQQNLPAAYRGYYDDHRPAEKIFTRIFEGSLAPVPTLAFHQLFTPEKTALIKSLQVNMADAALLQAISSNLIGIKTFYYNGEKYQYKDAAKILQTLQHEIDMQQAATEKNDAEILAFFYEAAKAKADGSCAVLKDHYMWYTSNTGKLRAYAAVCNTIMNLLAPLLPGKTLKMEEAQNLAIDICRESDTLKHMLNEWLQLNVFAINDPLNLKTKKFVQSNYVYFTNNGFINNELSDLHNLAEETMKKLAVWQLNNFKTVLQYQLDIYNSGATITAA